MGTQQRLTDLPGDVGNPIAGKIENQEVLESGDKGGNRLQAGAMDLPLLDMGQLDETVRQRLLGEQRKVR